MGTIVQEYEKVRGLYLKLKFAHWQFMMRVSTGKEVYEFVVVDFSPFKLNGWKNSGKWVDVNDIRGMLHLIQNVGEANMLSITKWTDIATPMLSNAFLTRRTLETVELYAKRTFPGAPTFGTALAKGVADAIKQGVVMSGFSIQDMDARTGLTPSIQIDRVSFKSSSARLIGI